MRVKLCYDGQLQIWYGCLTKSVHYPASVTLVSTLPLLQILMFHTYRWQHLLETLTDAISCNITENELRQLMHYAELTFPSSHYGLCLQDAKGTIVMKQIPLKKNVRGPGFWPQYTPELWHIPPRLVLLDESLGRRCSLRRNWSYEYNWKEFKRICQI